MARQAFWLDESTPAVGRASGHPLLGDRLPIVAHAPDTYVWEATLSLDRLPYLAGHAVLGATVLPYAAWVEMALAAAANVRPGAHRVTDLRLHHPVVVSATEPARVQVVLDQPAHGRFRFRAFCHTGASWTLSASATVI
jgi:acyl transferase domain-containing protein